MPPRPRPTVVLLAQSGTLAGVDRPLRRAGVRLVRLDVAAPRAVRPAAWRARAARIPSPDTVVVTSRRGVEAGVRPWRRLPGPPSPALQFWAAGPGTAEALRRAGIRGVRRPLGV
ncbi:MAG: uroporphyrinogen-III synthase, partial [Thermoplasmata archaeon]